MATISINDNDARIQYTQAVTANVTSLTIDFPFFELDDINVIRTTSDGVDTILSRGTGTGTFAVTGTSVDDGFSGGSITLGDTNDNTFTYTIFRDTPIARTSDFPTSGPFNISSLNTELDKIYAVMQQVENANDRALTLPDSDTTSTITLPTLASRKGKYLAFNSTTGAAEAGGNVADTGTVASQSANITLVAGQISPTNNIATVAGDTSEIATVASISSAISTVAGISSDVSALAAADVRADMALLATTDVIADMALLANADVISDMNTLATSDIVSDLNTLATSDIVTDLNILATSDNVTNMATLGASGVVANIATVAGINANVTTVAGIQSDVSSVAGISTQVSAVASDATDIGVVASNISDINTVASNIATISQKATLDDATALAIALG